MAGVRLAKHLAHAGVASRRAAEGIVRAGRVTVDGDVVTDPAHDVAGGEAIAVDGAALGGAEEHETVMLNKPAGVYSTAHDPGGRPTVVALVGSEHRLYPVGRLDADATGLLLLTNDGELANRLIHPRYEVPKTYEVTVRRGPVAQRAIRSLREGVLLDDGLTAPARVRRLGQDRLEIVLREGRKRQVKRMCEAVGHRVTALRRTAFGPLRLDGLGEGEWRELSAGEVVALRRASRPPRAAPARPAGGR